MHLSPIDFRLASASQGVWKLVNQWILVQGSRSHEVSGWDPLLKLTATALQEQRDFPFYKIPLRDPIHFSFSLKKNANKILFFL